MDASSRTALGLLAEMNVRYLVPVYQRPYSWDEAQCLQLWDDILACGRTAEGEGSSHFTGSIVTIQDGSRSAEGVATRLLIDGQQRITTICLLLVAMARLARTRGAAGRRLPFSFDEIVLGGFLTNAFRTGDDHHKLTLSKDDAPCLRSLVDNLERPDTPVQETSPRILGNLALLERRVSTLQDLGALWRGLQRLEVVSIELTQGRDQPQLIFESMNSTGRDLSCADLVRNFVLMDFPLAEQQEVYRSYWRQLEVILARVERCGAVGDDVFADFTRCYLTEVEAPRSFAAADGYQALKAHAWQAGYKGQGRMRFFCLDLRDHADNYAAALLGEHRDAAVAQALGRVARLGMPVAVPLEMALLDALDHRALTTEALCRLLGSLEAYLMRRAVCSLPPSVLPAFLSSLIARLDAVREREGNVEEALCAMLLNADGTPQAFPTDDEFARALRRRDVFHFDLAFPLLEGLNEALGDGRALDVAAHSVERISPATELGNLTLAPATFELQEFALAPKQERLRKEAGGPLALSQDVLAAREWTDAQMGRRSQRLARLAVSTWARPSLPAETLAIYRPRRAQAGEIPVSFGDLFSHGLVEMDDRLVSTDALHPGHATVIAGGTIMLEDGETFDDPTAAFARFLETLGASGEGVDGWMGWRRGAGGPLLDALRERLL